MPVVPTQVQGIPLNVPDAPSQLRGAGLVEQATGQLLEKLTSVGNDIYTRIKTHEAQTAASEQEAIGQRDARVWLADATRRSPDGNYYDENNKPVMVMEGGRLTPKTLVQAYEEQTKEVFERTQESLPSRLSQDIYSEKMGSFYKSFHPTVWNAQSNLLADHTVRTNTKNFDAVRSEMTENPVAALAYAGSDKFLENNKHAAGLVISHAEAAKNENASYNEGITSLVDGYVTKATKLADTNTAQAITEIDTAISVLKGEDAESRARVERGQWTYGDKVDPDLKGQKLRELGARRDSFGQHRASDWARRISDHTTKTYGGKGTIRQSAELIAEGNKLFVAGGIKAGSLIENVTDQVMATYAYPLFNNSTFKTSPVGRKNNAVEEMIDHTRQLVLDNIDKNALTQAPDAEAQVNQRIRSQAAQHIQKIEDSFSKDRAAAAMSFDDGVGQASTLMGGTIMSPWVDKFQGSFSTRNVGMERVSKLRGESPRYMSNAEGDQIKKMVSPEMRSQMSPSTVYQWFKSTQAADPARYDQIIAQLVEDKKLDPIFQWTLMFPDGEQSSASLDLMEAQLSPPLSEDDTRTLAAQGTTVQEFRNDVHSSKTLRYFEEIYKQDAGTLSENESKNLANLVERLALKQIRQGGAKSINSAMTNVHSFLRRNYGSIEKVSTGMFSSLRERVFIPARVNGRATTEDDRENITENMASIIRDLPTLNIQAPAGVMNVATTEKNTFQKWLTSDTRKFSFRFNKATQKYRVQVYDSEYMLRPWDLMHKVKNAATGEEGLRVLEFPITGLQQRVK